MPCNVPPMCHAGLMFKCVLLLTICAQYATAPNPPWSPALPPECAGAAPCKGLGAPLTPLGKLSCIAAPAACWLRDLLFSTAASLWGPLMQQWWLAALGGRAAVAVCKTFAAVAVLQHQGDLAHTAPTKNSNSKCVFTNKTTTG